MTLVTILQSAADTRPDWVSRCVTSVADWSQRQEPHLARARLDAYVFPRGMLGFLADLSDSIIERTDAAHIAPQMVGPKLLKVFNNLAQFKRVPEAGAVSPKLLTALAG